MRVLVGCELSGTVRDAFLAAGHDAWSCDLEPSDVGGPHIQADIRSVLGDNWDLMIGHPPCTRLCNSGVRWLAERNLWADLDEACELFLAMWNAPIPLICLENPTQHKHAIARIGVRKTQVIQPWMFGHGETKATHLWLKGLPKLKPTMLARGRAKRIHKMSPGKNRSKDRSKTYAGIASAMAQQWGGAVVATSLFG